MIMSSCFWQLYMTINDVASVTLYDMNNAHILHDTFLCNLLEQNGYLLSEINQ